MTHTLDLIRAKCIEANPEIAAVAYGCVMRLTDTPKAQAYYRKFNGTRLFRLSFNEKRWECTQGWIADVEVRDLLRGEDARIVGRPRS